MIHNIKRVCNRGMLPAMVAILAIVAGCAGHRQATVAPEPVAIESVEYYDAVARRTEDILQRLEQRLGSDDYRLVNPLATLAMVYFRQERVEESDAILDRVWTLIEKHPEIDIKELNLPLRYGTLPSAAQAGDERDVRMHLALGGNVNQRDSRGMTALHHAAINGNETMIRRLLENNAATTARDWEQKTARQRAEESGYDALAEILARHAASRQPAASDQPARQAPAAGFPSAFPGQGDPSARPAARSPVVEDDWSPPATTDGDFYTEPVPDEDDLFF